MLSDLSFPTKDIEETQKNTEKFNELLERLEIPMELFVESAALVHPFIFFL